MKFAADDAIYLSERKALSDKMGPQELWSVADHWPLYCGVANLARFTAIADILRGTAGVPGHVAEFGSWKGANLMYMAKLLRVFDPHGSKVVHAFDSFAGLTEFQTADGSATEQRGAYAGNLAQLEALIALYRLQDEITIHQGIIENTLPEFLNRDAAISFSFVYCDTDLYGSTLTILNGLHSRLSRGGVFVLDQWNYDNYPGETVAVREFLEAHPKQYAMEHVPYARQPSLVLRKE
jgi:hypothetical protein